MWEGRIQKLVKVLARHAPQLQSLEYIDPCQNWTEPCSALPPELGQLSQLTKLSIGMGLAAVSTARVDAMLLNLPSLQHLRLKYATSSCSESEFPLGIVTSCAQLRYLEINRFVSQEDMPPDIGCLTRLTSLVLEQCEFISLSHCITQLTALRGLSYRRSFIVSGVPTLPPGLTACQLLTSLMMSSDVKSPTLAELHSLRYLFVAVESRQMGAEIYWTHLTGLTELVLECGYEDACLDGLAGMISLRSLTISMAYPCRIPSGPYLCRLESLYFKHIKFLDGLPKCLAAATQLRHLHIIGRRNAHDGGSIGMSYADTAMLAAMPLVNVVVQPYTI